MLYLEDYLEMIEHLPQELRDRFTEIREMDLQVHNAMDTLDEQVKHFFSNAKRMKPEQRDAEYDRIRQEYLKTLEDAEEKVHLASQIYELVEKYLRRLDQELQKFKIELEADNSGITEILERRSFELDNPPHHTAVNHIREKKRHSQSIGNTSITNASTGHTYPNYSVRDSNVTSNSTFIPNNLGRINANTLSHLSTLVSSGSTNSSNGNTLLTSTLGTNSPSLTLTSNSSVNPVMSHHLSYNLGPGNNAIAAAASVAIAATQQMQQGRRTASLKASYEAINSGLQNLSCDFSALREGSLNASIGSIHGQETGSSHRPHKRSRGSSHLNDTDESAEDNGVPGDWSLDPNEPRYCLCNQVSYGDMVACDNEECQYEWFHYGCVGITQPPKGKWFCPSCLAQMKKRNRKEKI